MKDIQFIGIITMLTIIAIRLDRHASTPLIMVMALLILINGFTKAKS
jgi:hypothetical protein